MERINGFAESAATRPAGETRHNASAPKVSWIMPAYNAESYIRDAIESVLAQSETDWELIVADDGSTDSTLAIINDYARRDARIRVLHADTPSGGPYVPRRRAVAAARAEIISPLDADDAVEPDYLRNLLSIREATGACIVYPTMIFMHSRRKMVDMPNDLYDKVIAGRDAVKFTLDGWRIGCNGGVLDRNLYLATREMADKAVRSAYIDEFQTRLLLLKAHSVAFSITPYLYRENPASITRKKSVRLFDFLINNGAICDMAEAEYGRESEEYRLAQRQNFNSIFDSLRTLGRFDFTPAERRKALALIAEARSHTDMAVLRSVVSRKFRWLYNLPDSPAIKILRVAERVAPALAPARRKFTLMRENMHHRRDTKRVAQGGTDRGGAELLDRLYYSGKSGGNVKCGTVVMCDGAIHHGGLTDRMRGILSAYEANKGTGRPFYIYWDHPFPLTDYLIPAGADWRISREEISRNTATARPVVIDDLTDGQSLRRLEAAFRNPPLQLHLYTNADTARGRYAALYREVFRMAPVLEENVDRHLEALGDRYVSITTRFLTLLGDFNDWITEPLAEPEAAALIERVSAEVLRILSTLPEGYRCLVTSDSSRFLRHARDLDPRIYIVEGDVRNIDLDHGEARGAWLKTFTDQQLIMRAAHVYRIRLGQMYPTGFPRFAAECGGRPFTDIT